MHPPGPGGGGGPSPVMPAATAQALRARLSAVRTAEHAPAAYYLTGLLAPPAGNGAEVAALALVAAPPHASFDGSGLVLPAGLGVVGVLKVGDGEDAQAIINAANLEECGMEVDEAVAVVRVPIDADEAAVEAAVANAAVARRAQTTKTYVVDASETVVLTFGADASDALDARARIVCRATALAADADALRAWTDRVRDGAWLARVVTPGGDVRFVFPKEQGDVGAELTCSAVAGSRVELFHAAAPDNAAQATAPVFELGAGDGNDADGGVLDLEALALTPPELPVRDAVSSLLVPGLARAAAACAPLIAPGARVAVRHFEPPELAHPIAFAARTDADADDVATRQSRARAHALLALPADEPRLRASCAVALGPANDDGGDEERAANDPRARIIDVHSGLQMPGGAVLCRGPYAYFHYMQDGVDDKGWGCAYRSLQTIVSWFRLNHYTDRPVPSHAEIQQTLVRLGDKPKSFVGSKQWIGAIELGLFLQDYLDVSYKVMTVSRGDEMDQQGRALARHFEDEGTPIMVGGGVLAYTLLGVRYDESAGTCSYLILDPHYTGGDGDVGFIQKKRWVSWKVQGDAATAGGDLFVRDTFYNLLCPVRPRVV